MLTILVYKILIWIHIITIIYLLCFYTFFNIHILRIYNVLYLIIFKINVSMYRICIIFDTCIIYVHHSSLPFNITLKYLKLEAVNFSCIINNHTFYLFESYILLFGIQCFEW